MHKLLPMVMALVVGPAAAQDAADWINVPALEANDIAPDPVDRSVAWIGGNGGLFRFDAAAEEWTVFTTADGLSSSWIASVHADQRWIWAGTERSGINLLDPRTGSIRSALQDYDDDGRLTVRRILTAGHDAWLATDEGVLRLDASTLRVTNSWNAASGAGDDDAFDLAETSEYVWAATAFAGAVVVDAGDALPDSGGLTRIARDGSSIRNFRLPERGTSHFFSVASDDEEVWVGGLGGLFRFDAEDETFHRLDEVQGSIRSILIDGDVVWCTSAYHFEEFLHRIDRSTGAVEWSRVLPTYHLSARLALMGGDLIITKGTHVLRQPRSGGEWTAIDDPFLPAPFTQGIAGDAAATYVGSRAHLVEMDARSGAIRRSRDLGDGAALTIRSISIDGRSVWAGSDQGLFRVSRDGLEVESTFLLGQSVRRVFVAGARVWAVHNGRISTIDRASGAVETLSFVDDLPAGSGPTIYDVLADGEHAWLSYGVSGDEGVGFGVMKLDAETRAILATTSIDVMQTPTPGALADAGDALLVGGSTIHLVNKEMMTAQVFADAPARLLAASGGLVWAVFGTPVDGGVRAYRLSDGRFEFELRERDGLLRDYVTDLFAAPDGSIIWFTTSEGVSGLRTDGLPGLDAEPPPHAAPSTITSIFPNPSSGTHTVDLSVDRVNHVRLRLFDAAGRLLDVALDGHPTPGTTRLDLDLTHLAPGVYFWRLETESHTETRPVVIIR